MGDSSVSIISPVHIEDLSGFLEFLRSEVKTNDRGMVNKVLSSS